MSRAVFLPTPGDPFLISYWLRQFTAWRDLVDTLYVYVSWPQDAEVIGQIQRDVEAAGGVCILPADNFPHEHGRALNALLDQCVEDVVFMCEDDVYIRDRVGLAECFERVEQEGVVFGVSRGSMSMEIVNAVKKQYKTGAALWPFLIARTEDLRFLTEPFGARWWQPGEMVKGIHYTCVEACNADTFGAASMEIRGRLPVIEFEPAIWQHIGSLSSGPATDDYEHVREAAWSWKTRLEWWTRFYDEWPGGLDVQHAAYGQALDRLRATLR